MLNKIHNSLQLKVPIGERCIEFKRYTQTIVTVSLICGLTDEA